ncbi:DUF7282 domain-containing protein [Modestobacter sp. URMC 112]
MNRSRLLLAAAVSALFVLPACGGADEEASAPAAASISVPGGASPTSGAPAAPAGGGGGAAAGDAAADVTFEDQAGAGDLAVLARVALPVAGFVVVTRGDDDDDRVLGTTVLPAGVVTDVQVPLDPPLTEDDDLEATLYADTDGNGVFDPAQDDVVPEPDDDGDDEDDDVSEEADYDVS